MTTLENKSISALGQIRRQFVNGIPPRSEAVIAEWLTVDIMTNQVLKDAIDTECSRVVLLEMINAIDLVKTKALETLIERLSSRMSKVPFHYIRRRTPGEWTPAKT